MDTESKLVATIKNRSWRTEHAIPLAKGKQILVGYSSLCPRWFLTFLIEWSRTQRRKHCFHPKYRRHHWPQWTLGVRQWRYPSSHDIYGFVRALQPCAHRLHSWGSVESYCTHELGRICILCKMLANPRLEELDHRTLFWITTPMRAFVGLEKVANELFPAYSSDIGPAISPVLLMSLNE